MKSAAKFITLLAVMLTVSACAKSPKLQYVQARAALTETEWQLVRAAEAGQISSDEVLVIDPAVQAARAALADAEGRIAEGGPAFKADMRLFWAVLGRLAQVYAPPEPNNPGTN